MTDDTLTLPARSANAILIARLRQEALAKGLCYECRARPRKNDSVKRCQVCLDRQVAKKKAYRNRFRCECSAPAAPGIFRCRRCNDRHRAAEARRIVERKAQRLCIECEYPVERADRVSCDACLRRIADNRTQWYRKTVNPVVAARHCTICGDADHNRRGHDAAIATRAA